MQKQVAERLNVSEATVHNWEKNHPNPGVRFIPRIIELLGYTPFAAADSLPERLRTRRLARGLSTRKLAKMLAVDPGTLRSWEIGRHAPSEKSLRIINAFCQKEPVCESATR
jgi:transcriptional regulator with XRE-family HTH domain